MGEGLPPPKRAPEGVEIAVVFLDIFADAFGLCYRCSITCFMYICICTRAGARAGYP